MTRLLLALLTLIVASPAYAQAWGPAGQQTISYATGVVGDGSDSQGGTPPAFEDGSAPQEKTNIASDFTTVGSTTVVADWLDVRAEPPQRNAFEAGSADPDYHESKMRIHCQPSHVSKADPLLEPGDPDGPHPHQFAGNTGADENSTYESLRTTGGSTCSGGPVNRSAYWNPLVLTRLASGLVVGKWADWMIIYYPSSGVINRNHRLPRGFNYIFGYDPSEPLPLIAAQRAAVTAANTAAGWNRISIPSGMDAGAITWTCEATSKAVPYLVGPSGEDMFAANDSNSSTTDAACPQSSRVSAKAFAPRCWDGKNLSSTTARLHVVYPVQNNASGNRVCPDNWYWLPDFQQTMHFTQTRNLEYLDWYLGSDRMNPADTPADPSHPSPCRQVGPWFCPGETWHGDWFGAWDYGTKNAPGVMMDWMSDCTGIILYQNTGSKVSTGGADCGDSQISNSAALLTNNDPSPDPDLSLDPVIDFVASTVKPVADRYAISPWIDQTDGLTAHGSHGPSM